MKVICLEFERLFEYIKKKNLKIVMYGAGAIGKLTVPNILKQYNMLEYIDCYIDNDSRLWNQFINIEGNLFEVKSKEYLKDISAEHIVFLNISRFISILEELDNLEYCKNLICVPMAMMCIHNYVNNQNGIRTIKMDSIAHIPKLIHYIWIGNKNIPDNLQKCLDSWKRYCPDYKIICWNESNYNFRKNQYMREAYDNGAYAFVSDYARLDILYHYGGIYFDTDVELIRNIDEMLYQDAFCSVEKWQVINTGGGIGAIKGHDGIKNLLDFRRNLTFLNRDGSENRTTCVVYDTEFFLQKGYIMNGCVQNIEGINIYTSDYFHPFDYASGKEQYTKNTFGIHRFNGGWLSKEMRLLNEKTAQEYDKWYHPV